MTFSRHEKDPCYQKKLQGIHVDPNCVSAVYKRDADIQIVAENHQTPARGENSVTTLYNTRIRCYDRVSQDIKKPS